ncbi:MAG: DedA family protein [Helicobacteraceae bacterium]|jgi:membrane protein DedA with SNARE-associated domain|nr:DedA family protein [Helicobacteraceae bacterium]
MESITENLQTYGYAALFFYSLGGGFLGLIAAGALSGLGYMNIAVSIAVAFAANVVGDQILFLLARFNKKEFRDMLKKHRRKLALSHILIKKQGVKIIIAQKFFYGLKTLIPIAVGFTQYNSRKFFLLNLIGAVLFVTLFGLGSFYASEFFKEIANYAADTPIIFPIAVFIILAVFYIVISKMAEKKLSV